MSYRSGMIKKYQNIKSQKNIFFCKRQNLYTSLLPRRFIDHGNGTLTLRIQDPFVFDSGCYSCIVSTREGDCTTQCIVDVEETFGNIFDVMPELIKPPLPVIAFQSGKASFCTRITPVDSEVTWNVCGREISVDAKDIAVSFHVNFIYRAKRLPLLPQININYFCI